MKEYGKDRRRTFWYAFNSLIQLEHEKGIPRNPFINAGAIVIADILVS
jgi:glutaminase